MDLREYANQNAIHPSRFKELLAEQGLTVSTEIVRRWLKNEQQPGPKTMAAIEGATGGQVTRYDLRPDVFGERPAQGEAA